MLTFFPGNIKPHPPSCDCCLLNHAYLIPWRSKLEVCQGFKRLRAVVDKQDKHEFTVATSRLNRSLCVCCMQDKLSMSETSSIMGLKVTFQRHQITIWCAPRHIWWKWTSKQISSGLSYWLQTGTVSSCNCFAWTLSWHTQWQMSFALKDSLVEWTTFCTRCNATCICVNTRKRVSSGSLHVRGRSMK